MRTRAVFLILTMMAACGGTSGRVLRPQDAGGAAGTAGTINGGTTGVGGSSSEGGGAGAGGTSTSAPGGGSAGSTSSGGTISTGGSSSIGGGSGGVTSPGGSIGGASTGGVAAGGSGGTTSTGGRAGGATGHASCQTDADCTGVNQGYKCCNNLCSNTIGGNLATGNDILNCGACGNICTGSNPYCAGGTCGAPTCQGASCAAGTRCCGSQCCGADKLCCRVNTGPEVLGCFDPVDGTCPPGCSTCVCASPDTPIATPMGYVAISNLHPGDLVYSEHEGALVAVPLLKVARRPAAGHLIVHVVTAKGAVLNISGPHPTADGRTFSDLKVGDLLDGDTIIMRELRPYPHAFTYDILPASSTGTYVANGLLIGSTLK
jgi:hypothetical protein